MKNGKTRPSGKADLRLRAEEELKKKGEKRLADDQDERVHEDAQRLVHELQVHQVELEMQNEELVQARNETDALLAKYLDLYDFAPIGYFTLNPDGKILRVNLTGAGLLGVERSRLTGRKFQYQISGEFLPTFTIFLTKTFEGERTQSCEVLLVSKGYPARYVQLEARLSENVEECHVAMIDITDRRQAEEALSKSEHYYRELFNSMQEGFYIAEVLYDGDGKPQDYIYLDVNPALTGIMGLTRAQIIGKRLKELVPEVSSHWLEIFQKIALTGTQISSEFYSASFRRHLRTVGYRPFEGQIAVLIEDITTRKQAEEARRQSEERLNLALTASETGVWEWDIETGTTFWSPECFKIMDVKDSAGKLADFTDALHPEDAARVRAAIDRVLAEKTGFQEEFRVVTPEGEVRWLANLGRLTCDENGKPLRMTGTVQDITQRKKNEEVLQRYELLAGHSRDIILFIKSDDGRILEANTAAVAAYGYTREELLGLTIHDLRAAQTAGPTAEQMAKADAHGLLFETVHRRKDGNTCPMEVSSRGATIGGTRALVSVIRDITKRKKAEIYRNLAAEVLRILNDPSVLDDSVALILEAIKTETGFDAVGIRLRSGDDFPYFITRGFSEDFIETERLLCVRNEAGTILRDGQKNPVLACMCGTVLRGRTKTSLPFFTEGGSFWTNSTTDLLASTTEADREAQTRNRCHTEGYETVALIPLRSGSEIMGLLQLNDRRRNQFTPEMITFFESLGASVGIALTRKQTERMLQERTKELENANKELESFSYSVTHDLRAPLRAIEGYSKMLLKRKGDQFDTQTKRQFDLIRDNAQSMSQLIDDILAFSRLGKQEVVMSRIDMEGLVREIWGALCTINPDRQVSLRAESLPPGMGDIALIRQVLTNLLSNAIKYTGKRDAALVEVGYQAGENENVYFVRDNGAGFDMAYYGKLFGVFQRLHSPAEFEGTGVGLAIVQRIVHRHGGRVWAEAEVDKGATFYFTLKKCDPVTAPRGGNG